jgi:hypothetical protein
MTRERSRNVERIDVMISARDYINSVPAMVAEIERRKLSPQLSAAIKDVERLALERDAALRQNADLQAANNRLLEGKRAAEAAVKEQFDLVTEYIAIIAMKDPSND